MEARPRPWLPIVTPATGVSPGAVLNRAVLGRVPLIGGEREPTVQDELVTAPVESGENAHLGPRRREIDRVPRKANTPEILRLPRPLPSPAGAVSDLDGRAAADLALHWPREPRAGSMAPLKMNFTVPPAPVRCSWRLTGCGSDSVPSLQ